MRFLTYLIENKSWKKEPREYYAKMMKTFGKPDTQDDDSATWNNPDNLGRTWVRNEVIPHNFPAKHIDYVYSEKKIKVKPELTDDFANVTGSIIIDGLKGTVTARCGMLVKNAVTLGFVEDVVKGKTKPTKDEYKRRILDNEVPAWYKDSMKEVESTKMEVGKK